jgi:hypothetical protein
MGESGMHCGVCGTPIPEGRAHCLYCGATVKYALTEQGNLPYEQISSPPGQSDEPDKMPAPRWDLEGPEGNAHSRWLSMRDTYSRWAALERRRRVSKSALGCFSTGILLLLIFASCGILSFMESREVQQTQAHAQGLSASEMTATAITDPDPYPPHKGLIKLNDSLSDSNGSGGWMDYASDPTTTNQGCAFKNNAYTATQPQQNMPEEVTPCLAYNTDFQNFAYQITMANDEQGSSGGIVFRQCAPGAFYYFYIAPNGSYGLWINTGKFGKALAEGYSKAIYEGTASNVLGVVASGSTLNLYVNQQYVTSVSDATYSWGRIGTAVRTPDRTEATERTFNNAQVWAF